MHINKSVRTYGCYGFSFVVFVLLLLFFPTPCSSNATRMRVVPVFQEVGRCRSLFSLSLSCCVFPKPFHSLTYPDMHILPSSLLHSFHSTAYLLFSYRYFSSFSSTAALQLQYTIDAVSRNTLAPTSIYQIKVDMQRQNKTTGKPPPPPL